MGARPPLSVVSPTPMAIATHGPLHGEIPGKNPFLADRFFPVFRETGVSTTPPGAAFHRLSPRPREGAGGGDEDPQ
jgi:hypothetical protein